MATPRKIRSSNAPEGWHDEDVTAFLAAPSVYESAAATEADGWLSKHDPERAGVVRFIGATARKLSEVAQVRRFWNDAHYIGTLAYVTLDTDPEVPGRPESRRPGVPAVVAVECEGWGDNGANVAIVYHVPERTFVVDDVTPSNPTGTKALAAYDGASAVAVLAFHRWTFGDIDRWQEEGRNAVRAVALTNRSELEEEPTDEREAMAKLRRMARL